ncbi:unnamed protein product [Phytomonas sp. Hart1]|nr:unnamed protein product [Phytomonas sp. Hart1]|eukprot:CCW71468.1 unnamed protein product [Phytomonas sp. isolate Hart1]
MFTKKPRPVHRARPQGVHGSTNLKNTILTRNDIHCGLVECPLCPKEFPKESTPPSLLPTLPLLIPDTDVVLQNVNAFEDSRVANIVFLSTVLAEVHSRNKAIYMRLQSLLKSGSTKPIYVFANDRHEQTHCLPLKDETPHQYNDRCIRVASLWYSRHVLKAFPALSEALPVIFATHNNAQMQRLDSEGSVEMLPNFHCLGMREYVETFISTDSDLAEKVKISETSLTGHSPSNSGANLFTPYLPSSALESGVQMGYFFRGKLRVSDSSCFFGEIRSKFEGHGFDRIIIPGRSNLNRAIHDDVVIVKLLPIPQWRGRTRGPNPNTINANTGPNATSSPLVAPSSEQEAGNTNADAAPMTEEAALALGFTATGEVVGIERMSRRPFCGSLDVEEVNQLSAGSSGMVSLLFRAKDNRIPRIRITTRHANDLKDKRLSVVIDDWPVNCSFPLGHYVEVLGKIGDPDTEAKVILMENDIPHYDFSQAVYDCLPKGQWSVTSEEEAVRLDLRDLEIVSVDPLGCRDIDDALHCRVVNQNHWEVGVHIADVTHFVREQTPIDEEAAKRSTSVYLVDRRINMLPQLLTENLCSLVEGEDRYAFSALWEFDENYNLVQSWFGKTIIRSRRAFYYGDAQRMIDDVKDHSGLAQSLRRLMTLARHFRAQREKDGALFLASQEFKFKVDMNHVDRTDMQEYETFEANSMVEEWMLYANVAVASKIYEHFPNWTLVRRHQRPGEGAFDALNEVLMKKLQMRLDDTSSLSLSRSLNACVSSSDTYFNKLIRILATRCLRQAQYSSSGEIPKDEYYHFGLAMGMYTHFTSPIRRYADVIVHRQLAAAIGIGEVNATIMNTRHVQALADEMNYRHEQAQRAGRDSQNLYTGFYLQTIESRGAAIEEDAYVVRFSDAYISVLVPKFGQESRILKESLLKVPELLDRVRVRIDVRGSNKQNPSRAKIECSILGYMRCDSEEAAKISEDLMEGSKETTKVIPESDGAVPESKKQKIEEGSKQQ